MILVAGGTGTLGEPLVRMLAAHDHQVRVLTRDHHKANDLRAVGVDVVTGDVRAPAAVAAAVAGCTTVISAVHGFVGPRGVNPATIDRDANRTLISAAVNAGVGHLLLVSVYGAGPDHPMSLHRMKYAAEQSLVDSGLDWTIVRPVPFIETWTAVIGAHLLDQNKALVFGRGDNPINMVSVRDAALAIDRALADPASRGQVIDVTGPACLTFRQIAEQLLATTAPSGKISQIPLPILRIMSVLTQPVAPSFARRAQAAVVMNTTDMTATTTRPDLACVDRGATTLDQLLQGSIGPVAASRLVTGPSDSSEGQVNGS
jgi:uncharacterized protein YbjT (DUF2867 family)